MRVPGDPFRQAKRDHAFNLVAARVVDLEKVDLRGAELIEALLVDAGGSDESSGSISKLEQGPFDDRLRSLLKEEGRRLRVTTPPESPVSDNLALVAAAVGLTSADVQVLQFAVACRAKDLRQLIDPIACHTWRGLVTVVAVAIGESEELVAKSLAPAGRLRSTGLLSLSDDDEVGDRLKVDDRLVSALSEEGLDRAGLLRRFVPVAPASTLVREDYAHRSPEVTLAARILEGALRGQSPGVNVLLYGPSGTGKSELARLLAEELGVPLLLAGTGDEDGNSPNAIERLTSLRLGHRMIDAGKGILLFDEMEDLFSSGPMWQSSGLFRNERLMSKQWFNALLEKNPVPTIWISNALGGVDPAFLRRFTYIVELGALTARQRRRVWVKHLGGGDQPLPANDLDRLVHRFEVSPGQIGGAVSAVRLALGGAVDRPTLQAVLEPALRVLGGRAVTDDGCATRYRPELVNVPVDLEGIAGKLARWRQGEGPGITLCLYGPPGTGKSAYVRYLAHRMDRPLIVKKGSDLLSKWLGESEQKIAQAFEEASKQNAVLLFDEVDSFLSDRRDAVRSWELTQTNEFLQQLEVTSGVVACTTNLFQGLDEAALRRFTFKIPFLFMRPEQALALFRQTLEDLGGAGEVDPDLLGRFANLTPGDFAAVARRLRSLQEIPTAAELLGELQAEVGVKTGSARRAGF